MPQRSHTGSRKLPLVELEAKEKRNENEDEMVGEEEKPGDSVFWVLGEW